jgi:hypothetical protein
MEALVLAFIAVRNLYRRQEAIVNALSQVSSRVAISETEMPPLDLSHLRNLPHDKDRSGTPESRPQRPTVYPPPVPFNYPNV